MNAPIWGFEQPHWSPAWLRSAVASTSTDKPVEQILRHDCNACLLGIIYRWDCRSGAELTCSGLQCDHSKTLTMYQPKDMRTDDVQQDTQ